MEITILRYFDEFDEPDVINFLCNHDLSNFLDWCNSMFEVLCLSTF